ncbi:MAG: endonuclease/exonuclease/phosphatase family protein [Pirellulales bacterium]
MKSLATLLLVALLLASPTHGQSVRVATYNLNWGNRRVDQAIDAIMTAKADILCLQETTLQSEQLLHKRLADRYPEFHSVGHNGQYAAERFVLASTTRPRELAFHPPGRGLFGFYTAMFRIGNRDVRLVIVHLTPFQMRPGDGLRDALEALSTTEDVHAAEIEAVVKTVNADQPTIVLGDFNSLSTFKAPKRLVQLGFVDSFASVTAEPDTHPTWYWPTRPLPLSLRIDYVFHTRHFQTTKAEIIRRDGSDHYLVVAELRLGEPKRAPEPRSGHEKVETSSGAAR